MDLAFEKNGAQITFPQGITQDQVQILIQQLIKEELQDYQVLNAAVEQLIVEQGVEQMANKLAKQFNDNVSQFGADPVIIFSRALVIFGSPSLAVCCDAFEPSSEFGKMSTFLSQIFCKVFAENPSSLFQKCSKDFLESESSETTGQQSQFAGSTANQYISFLGFAVMIPSAKQFLVSIQQMTQEQQELIGAIFVNINPRYYQVLEVQQLAYQLLTPLYFSTNVDLGAALQLLEQNQDEKILDTELAVAQYAAIQKLALPQDSERVNTFVKSYFINPNVEVLLDQEQFKSIEEQYRVLDFGKLSQQFYLLAKGNLLEFSQTLTLLISAAAFAPQNGLKYFRDANEFQLIIRDDAFDLEKELDEDTALLFEKFVPFASEELRNFVKTAVQGVQFSPIVALLASHLFEGKVEIERVEKSLIRLKTYHKRVLPLSKQFIEIMGEYIGGLTADNLELELLEQNLVLIMECIGVEHWASRKQEISDLLDRVRALQLDQSAEQSLNFLYKHFYVQKQDVISVNYSTILKDVARQNSLIETLISNFNKTQEQADVDALVEVFQHAGCLSYEFLKVLTNFGVEILRLSLSQDNEQLNAFAGAVCDCFVRSYDIAPDFCAALNSKMPEINELLSEPRNFGVWASVLYFCKLMSQIEPGVALQLVSEKLENSAELVNVEAGYIAALKLALSFGAQNAALEPAIKKQVNKVLRAVLLSKIDNPNVYIALMDAVQKAFAEQFASIYQVFGLLQELIQKAEIYTKIEESSYLQALVYFIASLVAFEFGTVFNGCQQLKASDFLVNVKAQVDKYQKLDKFEEVDYLILVQLMKIVRNNMMHEQNQKQMSDNVRAVLVGCYKLLEKLFHSPLPETMNDVIKQVLISYYVVMLNAGILPILAAKPMRKGDLPINHFTSDLTQSIFAVAKQLQWLDQNALEITLSLVEAMYGKDKFKKSVKTQKLVESLGDYLQNQIQEDQNDEQGDEDED